MDQPVTTNPFVIMLINMTVVFIVLVSLSFLIRLIHYFDPTKAPEPKPETPKAVAPPPPVVEPQPVVEEGIPAEVIAVICAVVAGYGYSAGQIHAIHPIHNQHTWENSVRYDHHQPQH